jgi:hypothetical protein
MYYILNYLVAVALYFKAAKYYFPHTKPILGETKQYFHEDYPSFNRHDYDKISLFKIYLGVVNYFWLKITGCIISFLSIYLSLK